MVLYRIPRSGNQDARDGLNRNERNIIELIFAYENITAPMQRWVTSKLKLIQTEIDWLTNDKTKRTRSTLNKINHVQTELEIKGKSKQGSRVILLWIRAYKCGRQTVFCFPDVAPRILKVELKFHQFCKLKFKKTAAELKQPWIMVLFRQLINYTWSQRMHASFIRHSTSIFHYYHILRLRKSSVRCVLVSQYIHGNENLI